MRHDIAARARALVGAPFRLQGRSYEHGLDCIGVVLLAFGLPSAFAPRYRLRDGTWPTIEAALEPAFRRVQNEARQAGDLLVSQCRGRFHFAVVSEGSFIHAHLGIGRVVEAPTFEVEGEVRTYRRLPQRNASWRQ